MKLTGTRVVLAGLALVACAAVIWRLGSSAMTSYRWSESYERGQRLIEEGSFAEAVSALEDSLFAMRDIGPEHPHYDSTRELLAESYEAIGRYDDAYPLYMEDLQRERLKHGSNSAGVAQSLYDLGRIRQLQGNDEAALGLFRQAIATWQSVHGNEHPDLIPTLTRLGQALAATENHQEAAQYLEWAIGLQRRAVGPSNPEIAPLEETYATVLDELGRTELAKQFHDHAEELRALAATETPQPTPTATAEPATPTAEPQTTAVPDGSPPAATVPTTIQPIEPADPSSER